MGDAADIDEEEAVMHRPDPVASLQEFLDDRGRHLRQCAFLACGSWAEADDALEAGLVDAERRGMGFEDVPAAERHVRSRMFAWLVARRPDVTLVDRRQDAGDPAERLLQALDCLEPRARAALVLARFGGLDDDRVAETLDTDRATAATLREQAVDSLCAELEHTGDRLDLGSGSTAVRWRHPHRNHLTTVERFEG